MIYKVRLEQMNVATSHHQIEVEVDAESVEAALEAAFEKAEHQDLLTRRSKPRPGEWRRTHGHNAKSIEVLEVVGQPS